MTPNRYALDGSALPCRFCCAWVGTSWRLSELPHCQPSHAHQRPMILPPARGNGIERKESGVPYRKPPAGVWFATAQGL